jgi:MFS family permease
LILGIIYGWMSLELIINREGLFYHMCNNSTADAPTTTSPASSANFVPPIGTAPISYTPITARISCPARNEYLTGIYTLGVSANIVSYIIWGIILDLSGPRITSCSSIAFSLLGNILLAFSNDTTRNMFHLGFLCVGIGGIGIHLASFNLANSAPLKHVAMATSLFPCIFNVSAIVFPFLNVLNLAGMSLSSLFAGFAVVLVFASAAEFWIQEWTAILKPQSTPYVADTPSLDEKASKEPNGSVELEEQGTLEVLPPLQPEPEQGQYEMFRYMPNKHHLSFFGQVKSWYFLWTVLFIASALARNAFWQGNVSRQLRSYGATSDSYAIIISWFPTLILLLLPFLGPGIDKYGLPFVLGIACIFQVVYAALALVRNVPIQLVTGLVAILSRAVVMTGYFSCVAIVCGYKTFGKASGMAMAAGGVVNFSSIPLTYLTNHQFNGDFFWVQIIQLAWGIPLLAYPWYLWRSGKDQALREKIQQLEATITPKTPNGHGIGN